MKFLKLFKMHITNKRMYASCLVIALLFGAMNVVAGAIALSAIIPYILLQSACNQLLLSIFFSSIGEERLMWHYTNQANKGGN